MTSGIIYSAVARSSVILVSNQIAAGDYESSVNAFLPNVPVERNTKSCFASGVHTYHILVEDLLIYICAAETNLGKNVPFAFLNEIKSRFTNGSLAIRALAASEHEFDRDFSYVLKDQMIRYNTDAPADGINTVKKQVEEVMVVMNDNIQKVVERGERMESLLDKTNELELSSNHQTTHFGAKAFLIDQDFIKKLLKISLDKLKDVSAKDVSATRLTHMTQSSQFHSTAKKVRRHMWCKNFKMWIILLGIAAVVITLIILLATNVIPVRS